MHTSVSANAALEANAQVNGKTQISDLHHCQTPQQILMWLQIYLYVPQGSRWAKFGWNRFGRYDTVHA